MKPILFRQVYYLLLFFPLLVGCTHQDKKTGQSQSQAEYIYRLHNEVFFSPPLSLPKLKAQYPWEEKYSGHMQKITKEFFRCKGNTLSPVIIQNLQDKELMQYYDCSGGKKHGLPLRNGKEFIYPCLIDILNALQTKTNKQVVITSGHRCPKHNLYVDHSPLNWSSKHMVGAEVDFYIEGMEKEPLQVITLIQQYYKETFTNSELTTFHRYEKEGLNVSTPPWYNKEIFIKLYLEHEGRNIDNRHPYPYIGIQVRHDRETNTKVLYDPKDAQNYLRH